MSEEHDEFTKGIRKLLAERKAWIKQREDLRKTLTAFLSMEGDVNDVIDAAMEVVGKVNEEPKLLTERPEMQAEIKKLRGMMATLINAGFNTREWHEAMNAIGYEVTDTKQEDE